MAESLSRIVEDWLRHLVLGPPTFDADGDLPNMVVYPIYPTEISPDPSGMVSLSDGLRKGVRLSDTGLVSQVHVNNPLDAPILVGESDILIGPTQLRSVQISCLVPPNRRASLPVSCVEAGQPTVYQAEFTAAEACPWYIRSFKTEQLARHGEPHQHRIWDNIKSYLQGAGAVVSKTHDVRAVFSRYGADLRVLSDVFPAKPGQVGVVSAVGQDLFLELFGDPEMFEERYEKVLESALIEAVAHPTDQITPPGHARDMLDELAHASRDSKLVQSRSLESSGRSLVFSADGISGSALLSGSHPVHLAAHKRCWGYGKPFADQLDELESGRKLWNSEQRSFVNQLERDYSQRRRRYKAFKDSLKPKWATSDRHDEFEEFASEEEDSSPAPVPLNPAVHEFFLQLFKK